MEGPVSLRAETRADWGGIRRVHLEALGRPAEADLVEALRLSPEFLPELSLVAEREGQVIGHALFTRVWIGADANFGVGLAPIAIQPPHQRQGIGGQLIRLGLAKAATRGFAVVVLIGHPNYYPRFGFLPGARLGLRTLYDVPEDVWMAQLLRPDPSENLAGEVRYSPAFDGV